MESSMAALDASADWKGLWRQLTQLGWRLETERQSNISYYIPPAMGSMQKAKSTQRDYYDTQEQVREYLVSLKAAKASGSGRPGPGDRPSKRSRESDAGEGAAAAADGDRPRERKRSAAASPAGSSAAQSAGKADPAPVKSAAGPKPAEPAAAVAAAGNGAAGAGGNSNAAGANAESAAASAEAQRMKEAAAAHSRGGRRARMIDVPKHLYTNPFAAAVHTYIKDQGMSQDALGSRTGLRQQQISGWLFGKCSASMHEMVERTLRKWFQQRGVDLDKDGVKPDLAAEDKLKLLPPGHGPKKPRTSERSSASATANKAAGVESDDDTDVPPVDGSWYTGEVLAVTSDGVDAAPFWLSVCLEKRRVSARKVKVRWLKAVGGIETEKGPLAYTSATTYVFDEETGPEQVFADTVVFRTGRRVSTRNGKDPITLSADEFKGAVTAAEDWKLVNQTSEDDDGSGDEELSLGELSPGQQVAEFVKEWSVKALIFSSDYEQSGGLMATQLMERFKDSEKDLEYEVTTLAFHTGVLQAVQSVLGKAVRSDDIKIKDQDVEDPDFRYYARFRSAGDMEGTGGWSVSRALPQVNPLSPNPSMKVYSLPYQHAHAHAHAHARGPAKSSGPSGPSRGWVGESKHSSKGGGLLKPKAMEEDEDDEEPAEINFAWLCRNCLARNLEKAVRCIDCGERRAGTVDGIVIADDGCNWACCSNGRPFSIFKTAVGYDKRMLLHKQTPKQATEYAGIHPKTAIPSQPGTEDVEQAVRDTVEGIIERVEKSSAAEALTPEVMSEHPERPDRASCAFRRLEYLDLLENTVRTEDRVATTDEVQMTHGAEYIQSIAQETVNFDGLEDCYINTDTSLAAKVAAGTTMAVVEKVVKGEAANGVAIVRPPGHHACAHKAAGFCFINNVAVAARTAQKLGVKRIMIVDWDVHHGNGTQDIFYDDPTVLTVSIHRGDPGFFPQSGKPDELGRGRGEGFNINIAWSSAGMGNSEYMLAMSRIIAPVALQFQPELVIVAAGFDSGKGDPWGECNITVPGYAHLTSQLMSMPAGKLVLVLEGGYNLKTVSHSLAACVRVLRGAPPPPLLDLAPPLSTAVRDIRITENRAGQYWSVFGCSRAASIEEMEEMERFAVGGAAAARMHSQLGDLNVLTVIQLRKLCVTRRLGTKGQKVDLVAKLHADDRNVVDANRIWRLRGHKFVGRRLKRSFKGFGEIEGCVLAWHTVGKNGMFVFHVVHDDGDEEDLGTKEVGEAIDHLGEDWSPSDDDESGEEQDRSSESRWSNGEMRRFDAAMSGRVCDKSDWHAVSMHVGTRDIVQCKSYAKRLKSQVPFAQRIKQEGGPGEDKDVQMIPTMLYQTLHAKLHAVVLDDNDEVACNHINSQFSDKELRFLMARNRSKFPKQLAMTSAQKEAEATATALAQLSSSPTENGPDGEPKAKSRDRDVGKKQKIRLLLPLLRAGGLLPPTSAEVSMPVRPARPAPLKQYKGDYKGDGHRNSLGEGRWSSREIEMYEEACARFGPQDWTNIAAYVGTRDTSQCRRFARRRRESASASVSPRATPSPLGQDEAICAAGAGASPAEMASDAVARAVAAFNGAAAAAVADAVGGAAAPFSNMATASANAHGLGQAHAAFTRPTGGPIPMAASPAGQTPWIAPTLTHGPQDLRWQQPGFTSAGMLGSAVMPPMQPVAHSASDNPLMHNLLVQSATSQALQMSPGGSVPDLRQFSGTASLLMGVAPQENLADGAPQQQPTFLHSPPESGDM